MMNTCKRLFCWPMLAGLLTACGNGPDSDAPGQVIARVNNDEITVHQLDLELERLNESPDVDSRAIVEEAVHHLVDRQLLVQQAKNVELERIPQVMVALERAHDQVLAGSYTDQIETGLQEPTREELVDYYDQHPALYSERRIYNFRQLIIELQGGSDSAIGAADVVKHLNTDTSIGSLLEWLEEVGLPYRLTHLDEAAENLPGPVLDTLVSMEPGQRSRIELGEGVVVVYLLSERPAHLLLELALPKIKRILSEDNRRQLVESHIENLRNKAAIVYFSDVAGKLSTGEHQ